MLQMNKLLVFCLSLTCAVGFAQVQPPVCPKQPKVLSMHGDNRNDDYYWLNQYWLKGPDSNKVVQYLTEENNYFEAGTKATKPLQEKLYKEILGKIKQTDQSLPYFLEGYWYITKTRRRERICHLCAKEGHHESKGGVVGRCKCNGEGAFLLWIFWLDGQSEQ